MSCNCSHHLLLLWRYTRLSIFSDPVAPSRFAPKRVSTDTKSNDDGARGRPALLGALEYKRTAQLLRTTAQSFRIMQHSCFVTSSNIPCVTMSRLCTLLRLQHKSSKHAHTHGAIGHTPLRSLDKMRLDWLRCETGDVAVLNASDGSVQSFPNSEGRRHQLHNNRMHNVYTSTLATIPALFQRRRLRWRPLRWRAARNTNTLADAAFAAAAAASEASAAAVAAVAA